MNGGFRIVADRNVCIGAGQCVMVSSELFAQDEEDGLVIVRVPAPDAAQRSLAEFAATSCPTRALAVEDE